MHYLLLIRGGDRRHIGGGGNIRRGGLNLRGAALIRRGARTAEAVISCPSICPGRSIQKTQGFFIVLNWREVINVNSYLKVTMNIDKQPANLPINMRP